MSKTAETGRLQASKRILIKGASLATMDEKLGALGVIDRGAVVVANGRIQWVSEEADLPKAEADAGQTIDLHGGWLLPGFIDCHTHLVFAGNRADEFERRLKGESYEDIARSGGGILSTVRATRAASEDELVRQSRPRLDALAAEGVTTVEIKSGYGLDLETEVKMLRAARRLGRESGVRVSTSFLGAHAIPPEYAGRADDYVTFLVDTVMPRVAAERLADVVDGFCETIAFNAIQMRRVFEGAKKHLLPVRLHADQRTDQGGGALAAEFGALSAEHLEFASDASIAAMAKAGVVATMLPGAFYALKETTKPPIQKFREAGVRVAVASDCNPGSAPIASLLTTLNMACVLYGLTPEEALNGVTINAATALALESEVGSIAVGKVADLVHWPISRPAELCYWIGAVKPDWVMRSGRIVSSHLR
jgi:imidazolonepropionase